MACNCIDDYRQAIKNEFGADARISTTCMVGYKDKNGALCADVRPATMGFEYRRKKADGEPMKSVTRGEVTFTYCPFCGVKYLPKESE